MQIAPLAISLRGEVVPAIPNTFAHVYDVDGDADGLQSFKVIAWLLTYENCRVGGISARMPFLVPIGVDGQIDITKPHAIQIGGNILANGCRFPTVSEWLESHYGN